MAFCDRRMTISSRDEIATMSVPSTEEATARMERRGACTSERLALVVHSPRVGRAVLGARAAAAAGAASRVGVLRRRGGTERSARTTGAASRTSAQIGTSRRTPPGEPATTSHACSVPTNLAWAQVSANASKVAPPAPRVYAAVSTDPLPIGRTRPRTRMLPLPSPVVHRGFHLFASRISERPIAL